MKLSDTEQVCSLGSAAAGTYPVSVSFPSLGNSLYADDNILYFTYQLIVSSFAPESGSVAGKSSDHSPNNCEFIMFNLQFHRFHVISVPSGGTLLTVTGFGFSEDAVVTVGDEGCTLVHASDTELKCRTPAVRLAAGDHRFIDSYFNAG